LKKAVAYAIGLLALHKEEIVKEEIVKEKDSGLVKRTFEGIKNLAALLTVAYRVKQIAPGVPDIFHLPW
jgi:hypothetical protein